MSNSRKIADYVIGLFVDKSNGNVGLGTSSPSAKLDVVESATSGTDIAIVEVGTASGGNFNIRCSDLSSAAPSWTLQTGNAEPIIFSQSSNERMRLDSAGNLGLGVTPSAWSGFSSVLQQRGGGHVVADTGAFMQIGANNYYNGTNWIYTTTAPASRFVQNNGLFQWFNAASGTAGNAISFTQAMTLDASGNLGIGASSPTNSANFKTLDIRGTNGGQFLLGRTATASDLFMYSTSTGGTIGANASMFLRFMTNSDGTTNERMRLDSSGNLGLGVTPSAWGFGKAFEVGNNGSALWGAGVNDIRVMSNAKYDTGYKYVANGYANMYINGTANGSHTWFNAASGTAGNTITFTQAMTLDASGNLGVAGQTAPSTPLTTGTWGNGLAVGTTSGTNGVVIVSSTSSSLSALRFGDGGGGGAYDQGFVNYDHSADALALGTGRTERARIDSSGNFMVGKPSLTNTVRGCYIRPDNGNGGGFCATGDASTNFNAFIVTAENNGLALFYVQGNGDVKNTNNSYGAISDAKLKENVTDATPKLAQLNQVRVVNYNFIGDDKKQLGVVAQELEQVFPALIDNTPDFDAEGNDLGTTTKSVKYSVFVPMLIKAIQEQQALINNLTARLDAANI